MGAGDLIAWTCEELLYLFEGHPLGLGQGDVEAPQPDDGDGRVEPEGAVLWRGWDR